MVEKPITRKMKAQQETERQARLDAEYKAALARQQAEQQARYQKAQVEWEELLKALPSELDKLEQLILECIQEWEQKANNQINWDQIEDPVCSTAWELRFNQYERIEENIPHYYESSDGMRAGTYTDRVVRERMPGSYWVNPKYPHKEFFVSRAVSPNDPPPPVQYPYCTISGGEINLWDKFSYPNDKERVQALIQKKKQDQEYYTSCAEEARSMIAGTIQQKIQYLLNRREADRVRNELKKVWGILNPDKPQSKFWEDVLQALL